MERGRINNFAGGFCSDSQKKCMCRSEEGPAGPERTLDRVAPVLGRDPIRPGGDPGPDLLLPRPVRIVAEPGRDCSPD